MLHVAGASVDIKLGALGDSITSAIIGSWQKEAGEIIREDDVICAVETDKVFYLSNVKKCCFTLCNSLYLR